MIFQTTMVPNTKDDWALKGFTVGIQNISLKKHDKKIQSKVPGVTPFAPFPYKGDLQGFCIHLAQNYPLISNPFHKYISINTGRS